MDRKLNGMIGKSLPNFHSEEKQLHLFEHESKSINGRWGVTTHVGRFFEELTAVVLGAKRFKAQAGMDCPDLFWNGSLVECKALRATSGGRGILDIAIMDAYTDLASRLGLKLLYVFWAYDLRVAEFRSVERLYDALRICDKTMFTLQDDVVRELSGSRRKWYFKPGVNERTGRVRSGILTGISYRTLREISLKTLNKT